MRLAALFSGGKDSTYSVYSAQRMGHEIRCLVTAAPASEDSMLLHHPNTHVTRLQAEAMGIPHVYVTTPSEIGMEMAALHAALDGVRREHGVDGLVHGGILSRFQLDAFRRICDRLGLDLVSPVWHRDQAEYMRELVESGFRFIVTSVSSGGLTDFWLGREITAKNLPLLEDLSRRFGFNLSFEGGEAETLVTDCPLFAAPLLVSGSTHWDGYRGRFEIEEARLDHNAGRP